ncbi:uncharacterized protein LOC141856273 isoform X2 [Brevipalpus obovatus]|uniref:uncharacterized protein LOC141856273 isoform X2 n=1 Tax=Brevipalpus obovatus TaxID=246614 RepID=UPI003D9EF1D9
MILLSIFTISSIESFKLYDLLSKYLCGITGKYTVVTIKKVKECLKKYIVPVNPDAKECDHLKFIGPADEEYWHKNCKENNKIKNEWIKCFEKFWEVHAKFSPHEIEGKGKDFENKAKKNYENFGSCYGNATKIPNWPNRR